MTDRIPPQQELEAWMISLGYWLTYYDDHSGTFEYSKAGMPSVEVETAAFFYSQLAQTRTDTIREVEEQHQLDLAQSKLDVIQRSLVV